MVSSTLCPTVHILGSQNVYGRAEGIADHYWPWAVFFITLCSQKELSVLKKARGKIHAKTVALLSIRYLSFHPLPFFPSQNEQTESK